MVDTPPSGPQLSGKVFRFLSAMHPSLSKAERKRYAGFDPDKWYDWTAQVSAEFTDLMRRSPRDTSFARGFAYVAQRAVPEGQYIPTRTLLENLALLPAAFRGTSGSGFRATIDKAGHAVVSYSGMPGFTNVCIAIQGELAQRLQASGAQSVVVKHAETCRVNGGDECQFEIVWSGEAPPPDAQPVDATELLARLESNGVPAAAGEAGGVPVDDQPPAQQPPPEPSVQPVAANANAAPAAQAVPAAQAAPAPRAAPAVATAPVQAVPPQPAAAVAPLASAPPVGIEAAGAAGDELFDQLKRRLADADRQSRLYADAQREIDSLRLELGRVRALAETEVAKAEKEKSEAVEALEDLKRRIRSVIADD